MSAASGRQMLGKSQGSFTTLFSSRIQSWWELTSVITGSHWNANPVLATWGVGWQRELWGDSHSVLTSWAVVDLLPTTEAKGNTAQNHQTQAAFQLGHLPITRTVKADTAHCGVRGQPPSTWGRHHFPTQGILGLSSQGSQMRRCKPPLGLALTHHPGN